MSLKTLVSAAD